MVVRFCKLVRSKVIRCRRFYSRLTILCNARSGWGRPGAAGGGRGQLVMPGGIIYFVHGQLIFVEKIEFKYRNRCDRREKFKTNEHFKRKKVEIGWSRLIAFEAQRGPTNHFDPPRFSGREMGEKMSQMT